MDNLNSNYLDPSIRWTDKLTLCANGDIVESFSGKIVGHVTPEVYKEVTKNETLSIGFDYNEEELDNENGKHE